jgi:glyceraldehyde-3-phosphate dehydrogenase (NAD(P))
MKRIVHVVGTGTIGEPLIGLLADHHEEFGIDEVTFHKRQALRYERAKVNDLCRRGARLAVSPETRKDFEALGHKPTYEVREALERATVVIDCTPAGNKNKEEFYQHLRGPLGFIAQGSEFGFGKMYARGINDLALRRDEDRFIQVVSCNTHNLAVLVKTLAGRPQNGLSLRHGRFVCIRRANDTSQDKDFIPSPKVGKHDDPEFGTHHARDAYHLFQTMALAPSLYSSALKVNSQYMHALWFDIELNHDVTLEMVVGLLRENPRVAVTERTTANSVFSFGRDHGYFGRILSQTVVSLPTLAVRNKREILGFCFTPQDGNALLSSLAATLWFLYPEGFEDRIDVIRPYLFREV